MGHLLQRFQIICMGPVLGVVLAACLSPQSAAADDTPLSPLQAAGQRIYREGIGSTGEPIQGLTAGGVTLSGPAGACIVCHRRSGYGGSEGRFNIRPVIGPALFEQGAVVLHSPRVKAQIGVRLRPPYDDALLARALRSGKDSAGEMLDAVMPRFNLSDHDVSAVSAYLATLSATPSPGVDADEIHFATVIQPGVSPEKRRAMLTVLEAFFKDKGAEVRSEVQRREAGNMRMYRSYRKWVLHVWDLSGPAQTWEAQLAALYRQQPVFALVAGLGNTSWLPIHTFCEQFEIPSLFPLVDLPVLGGTNHYNFYLTSGLTQEAKVLARFFEDKPDTGRVVQVFRGDAAGTTASAAFRQAMPGSSEMQDVRLDGQADAAFWSTVQARNPGAVVAWLDAADLKAAGPLAALNVPVYLSFSQLGGKQALDVARQWPQSRLIYPSDLPPRHEARLLRTKAWLHKKGIPLLDEPTQINTQFAVTVMSDAIGHIMDSFSRDYLVERIEHVVGQTPAPSMYPGVSLGPGQRIASKGATVVLSGEAGPPRALSGWIVP